MRIFGFFFASAADVAENGLVACSEVRGLSPTIDVEVVLALLKCGIEGRGIEWAIGVLKALASEASIGARDRMVVVVVVWLVGRKPSMEMQLVGSQKISGRNLSFAAREGLLIIGVHPRIPK